MANLLFLHAHPDDEAIFTGGTIARLAQQGHNITVVFGTGGELGQSAEGEDAAKTRFLESMDAAQILGISHLDFLGYHDSGFDPDEFPDNAFATCDRNEAAEKLEAIIRRYEIDAIFFDDENGIYGHPDHRASHDVGMRAAQRTHISEAYTFTVDREQLHFLLTKAHVVQEAFSSYDFAKEQMEALGTAHGHETNELGKSSIEITHVVPINGGNILVKRMAMNAHKHQMPASVTDLEDEVFRQAYGDEWYVRVAVPGCPQQKKPEILNDISR